MMAYPPRAAAPGGKTIVQRAGSTMAGEMAPAGESALLKNMPVRGIHPSEYRTVLERIIGGSKALPSPEELFSQLKTFAGVGQDFSARPPIGPGATMGPAAETSMLGTAMRGAGGLEGAAGGSAASDIFSAILSKAPGLLSKLGGAMGKVAGGAAMQIPGMLIPDTLDQEDHAPDQPLLERPEISPRERELLRIPSDLPNPDPANMAMRGSMSFDESQLGYDDPDPEPDADMDDPRLAGIANGLTGTGRPSQPEQRPTPARGSPGNPIRLPPTLITANPEPQEFVGPPPPMVGPPAPTMRKPLVPGDEETAADINKRLMSRPMMMPTPTLSGPGGRSVHPDTWFRSPSKY